PDGNVHRFEYNAMGNMVHASDNIREVRFTYGALGVLKSREQERHHITFGYNSELQLRRIGNEAGDNYFFELDGLGQVVTETGFDGMRREYERDGAGRVTRVNRPGGKWTEYLYDGLDNILKEEQYDGEVSLYTYDKDGMLVKAKNSENLLEFTRDRKTGLITEERQGEYTVSRTYDGEGNCTRITSSLGADIRHTYDREGNLQAMQAGESWQASWVRDNTGLEVQRIFSGGVTVSTERDRFGCEVRKSVRSGGIERGAYRYEWGIANRLLSKENELTGTVMRYDYDRFDFLIRQETTQGSETDVIYRVPDFVGNLFGTPDRKDRKYGAGGKLLEDPDCFYHYDDEGNLIFREFKQLQETGVRYDRKRMEKERDIRCLATGTGWLYEWASNGMLKNVIRPDGRPVEFRYDALGRRTAKLYFGKVTRWVWDGNVPLHEWITTATDNDVLPNRNNITTWIFEEETLIPTAKIQSDKSCSIVSDYLGTPIQMYDGQGNKTWDCTLDIYGKVIDFTGKFLYDCPFRFQGQYEDAETGLYYNRFRYYSAEIGCYLTHDPIGLAGGILIYGYVSNPNSYIDPSGESSYRLGKNLEKNGMNHGGKVTFGPNGNRSTEWQAHHIIPEQVWRRNNVFFKEIGLRGRDSASNGVFLPNSKEVSSKNSLQYFHCGSHPDYNVTVDKEIKKIEAMYEFEKNNIKPDIAKANAINRIRNLQNDFRQKMSAYYTGEPASINNFH
ncbi:RHS repeat-associated core domain-containing protein, partial [Bacteroides thetaiotaomicron]